MRLSASLTCLLLALLQVEASSTAQGPLKRVHVPVNPSIRRLAQRQTVNGLSRRDALLSPHQPVGSDQLTHADTLLLRFQIDDEPISLVVRPSVDLLHPEARIHYHSLDPVTGKSSVRTEALRPEDVRAYEGHVVKEHELSRWWNEEQAGVLRSSHEVSGTTRGWARVVLPSGDSEGSWEGAFSLEGDLHTLMGLATYERTKHHLDPAAPAAARVRRSKPGQGTVVIRNSDIGASEAGASWCGHDALDYNNDPLLNPSLARRHALASSTLERMSYFDHRKRQTVTAGNDVAGGTNFSSNFISDIGNSNGCPKNRMIAYIGLAADCTYVSHYGSQSAARTQLLTDINSVSALYQQTFNVSIGAVELNVQDVTCPSVADPSTPWNVGCPEGGPSGLVLNDRLSAFSQWRGNKGDSDGAGLWHLLTNCTTGDEVGVAWLGTLCQTTATGPTGSVASGTGVTAITRSEWQVMSHEIGHNFNAVHDCISGCTLNGQCCPLTTSTCDSSSDFIMSPVSTGNVTSFSQCTVGNVCSLMISTTNTSCLQTPGQRTILSLQQCGNGIVDPGEECDPGQQTSTCCDATTCKFLSGAVCDPINSACCTSSCQLASQGLVCRPSTDARCDTSEVCTGSSPDCPADVQIPDGTSCGSDGLACASGICTSRDLQCQQQGSSLNISSACSLNTDSSCAMACNSPTNAGQCVILDNNFINGSPCGYAGTCSNGSCQAGSFIDAAKSWYTRNLQIAVPVTVVGGLLILVVLGLLARCLLSRRRQARVAPSSAFYRGAPRSKIASLPYGDGSTEAINKEVVPDSPASPAVVLARSSAPVPTVYGAPGLPPAPSMRSVHSSLVSPSRRSAPPLPYPPARVRVPNDRPSSGPPSYRPPSGPPVPSHARPERSSSARPIFDASPYGGMHGQ